MGFEEVVKGKTIEEEKGRSDEVEGLITRHHPHQLHYSIPSYSNAHVILAW